MSDQVGLKGAVYILISKVSGDSDGAGEEAADSSWLSERWMGIVGLPRVLDGAVAGRSLGRGGRTGPQGGCARLECRTSLF